MLSKTAFKKKAITYNKDFITFEMPVDFVELSDNYSGIDFINELVEEFVDDGFKLQGMSYKPLRVEGDFIIVEVCANCTDWENDDE